MVSTAGAIVIAIFVVLIVAAVGWIIFTQLRARRLGLPPPSLSSYIPFRKSDNSYGPPTPAPGGIVGWFNDRLRMFKNRNSRTAAGAYEQPLQGGGGASGSRGQRGFGPLDPDDAWDARVGHDDSYGQYDDRELGSTAYEGNSYNMNLAATPGIPPAGYGEDEHRGRTASRSPGLAASKDLKVPGQKSGRNPFDDDAEPSNISLRGVSPRPIDTNLAQQHQQQQKGKPHSREPGSAGSSPTERRSIFREDV